MKTRLDEWLENPENRKDIYKGLANLLAVDHKTRKIMLCNRLKCDDCLFKHATICERDMEAYLKERADG